MATDDRLEDLIHQVQASAKYSSISTDLVRSIGSRELAKRRSLKEAVKETRNKLHQVGSAYQEKPIPYDSWKASLSAITPDLADPLVISTIQNFLPFHSSTRERIPILPTFFHETLQEIAPVHSILDLACGLTPLCLPWMPVAPDVHYVAFDIYTDLAVFLNYFFQRFAINGTATTCDLTTTSFDAKADLALILKTIPCLEQIDKQVGTRLLEQVNAPNILVSFPAHSLGGKSKGMLRNYESHFMTLVNEKSWKVTRFVFPGELAFLVRK